MAEPIPTTAITVIMEVALEGAHQLESRLSEIYDISNMDEMINLLISAHPNINMRNWAKNEIAKLRGDE